MIGLKGIFRVRLLSPVLIALFVGGCSRGATDGLDRSQPAAAAPAATAAAERRLPVALPGGGAEPAGDDGSTAVVEAAPGQATARYVVPTITCPSCAERIKGNAKKDPGVVDVAVDLQTKRVTVVYDPSKTDAETIAAAIRKGGDTVRPDE